MMIVNFKTIIKAKEGDKDSVLKILEYYTEKAKKISKDEDYLQDVRYEILYGIKNYLYVYDE